MVLDGIKLEDDIVKKMIEKQNKVRPYDACAMVFTMDTDSCLNFKFNINHSKQSILFNSN